MRARLWTALAILLILATLAVVSAPKFVEKRIYAQLAAHPELQVEGLRVRPFLQVELDSVRLTRDHIQLHCQDIEAQPAFRFRGKNERIRHLRIEHCELTVDLDADTSRDEHASAKTPATRSYSERLEAVHAKISERLAIVRTLEIDALNAKLVGGEYPLTLQLESLEWHHRGAAHEAQALVRIQGALEADKLTVALEHEATHSVLRVRSSAPFRMKGRQIHVPDARIVDWQSIELSSVAVDDPHALLSRMELRKVELHLNQPLRFQSDGGELLLADADLASTILADATPEEAPEGRRTLLDDEPAPPEELWSLRSLARARRLVVRLDELLHDPTSRLPLELDIANIAILHDDETLMTLQQALLTEDEPLRLEARISQARLALTADPDEAGLWHFFVDDASLKRIASFLELSEHLDGRVDAKLLFRLVNGALTVGGELALRNGSIAHPAVSPEPVQPLHIAGMLSASMPADEHLEAFIDYNFQLNDLPLEASLRIIPVGERARFVAELKMTKATTCQAIWQAVPRGLVPDLAHASVRFTGKTQPALALNYVAGVFDSFQLKVEGFPQSCKIHVDALRFDPRRLNRSDYVHHVTEGVTRNDIFVGPGVDTYVPIASLPAYVPALMYLSEEINFYQNHGMSLGLINKAIRHSLPRRRFAYGGSTVTQQLVKNLYFSRTKTLARKFQEAVIVWTVETQVSKDRILELYLNCIEFGPDLYGIERASRHYFDKPARELSPLEAAWLAGLKPSPGRGRRDWQRGYSDFQNWNSERHEELLWRLVRYGELITPQDVRAAAPYVVYFPNSPNAGAKPVGIENYVSPPPDEADVPQGGLEEE